MHMSWAKRILLGILALPVVEIFLFVVVATHIGILQAFLVQVLCSLIGLSLIRSAGQVRVAHLRGAFADGVVRTTQFDGVDLPRLGAGLLLLVPGFLTDALGALLLIPAARRHAAFVFRGWMERQARGPRADGVIDLDRDQWQVQGSDVGDQGSARQFPRQAPDRRPIPDS